MIMPFGEEEVLIEKWATDAQNPADPKLPSSGNEVDIELLAFIERYAKTLIKWDILTFFGENPYTRDTASGIAQRIGRSPRIVLPELGDLVMLGLLEQTDLNDQRVYQLTTRMDLREMVFRFVERFSDYPRQLNDLLTDFA